MSDGIYIALIVVGGLLFLAFETGIISILIKRAFKKHDDEQKELVAKRHDDNVKETKKIVDDSIQPVKEKLEEYNQATTKRFTAMEKNIDDIREGNQSSLKGDITDLFYRCSEKGYKTPEEAQIFSDYVKSYHKLGGNSFIDHTIIPEFDALPLKTSVNSKVLNKKKPIKKKLVESK